MLTLKSILIDDEKVTSAALNDLNDRINNLGTTTYDSIPTKNSTNTVTSDEIYEYINQSDLVTAASLNNLNDRVHLIEQSTGLDDFCIVTETKPSASIETMNKIYIVGPNENDKFEWFVTKYDETNNTYVWVAVNEMEVDATRYATKNEVTELKIQTVDELGIIDTVEEGFFIVDDNYNVGLLLNEDGLFTSEIKSDVSTVGNLDNIPEPQRLIKINFITSDTLPTTKNETNPILAYGSVNIDFDGSILKKYATLEVQGASSTVYPKKNWTISFYNDKNYSEEFEFRLANMVPHSAYVFKSSWIDATHCRNIVSNRIWEQFVQSRDGYPKRETETAYDSTATDIYSRFDVGALGHVDGFPAVLYVNNEFYGIGSFNIGNKRNNYNLNKNSQTQVQMSAEDHVNFNGYMSNQWEVRNPKYPDTTQFSSVITPWFKSNSLTAANFKSTFPTTHNLQNAIDYYIFIEFLYADDCVDKNFILTTWDGAVFSFMPYDLDTTFGLWWNGTQFVEPTASVLTSTNNLTTSSVNFWNKFFNAYKEEIVARFNQLKDNKILSVDNVYNLCTNFTKRFGKDLIEDEHSKWPTIPSNSTIYTGISQIIDWTTKRLNWMDTYFVLN